VDTGGTCGAGKIRLPAFPANGQSESERAPPETVSLPLVTLLCLVAGLPSFPCTPRPANAETGIEFWCARDLQVLLGYANWENFAKVIEKAKTACSASENDIGDHLLDITKMIDLGKGAKREIEDIALTRSTPVTSSPRMTTRPRILLPSCNPTSPSRPASRDIRSLLVDRGIVPEALPPAEDVKKVEHRLASEKKKLSKRAAPRGEGDPG
jgi:hypothetical protein